MSGCMHMRPEQKCASCANDARDRECGACGGSGDEGCMRADCTLCPLGPCPVCQGSGRIQEPTEQEKRRDAIADAETLRKVVRAQPLPIDSWDAYPFPDCAALRCMVDPDLWARGIFHETVEPIVSDAASAAHEAFRAALGLRS